MTTRAFGALLVALGLWLLLLLALAGCDTTVEYHLHTYSSSEAPLDLGDVSGYLPGTDPDTVTWDGIAFDPPFPLGDVCAVGSGRFELFSCHTEWLLTLHTAVVTCRASSEGVFLDQGDQFVALGWVTCTCEGQCASLFVFVRAPTWYVGQRA